MKDLRFQNLGSSDLTTDDVISFIKKFLEEDTKSTYKLTIGTDSEIKVQDSKKTLDIVSAIVIYRNGFGGKFFWNKQKIEAPKTLRDKIYQEVLASLEIAKDLVPELKEKLNGHSSLYDLEIHIDVGEYGETRNMIREVVGIVTGHGFTAKTKPYSYAASNIADRYT